jgi:microcystin-dependent protein
LFAAIGTAFGAGDGTTTFGLPDLRDRVAIGSGTLYALAATGGSKDAIVVSHTHTGTTSTIGNHQHLSPDSQNFVTTTTGAIYGGGGASLFSSGSNLTQAAGTHNHTFTTDSTGSSGTNANLQPYIGLLHCIKF